MQSSGQEQKRPLTWSTLFPFSRNLYQVCGVYRLELVADETDSKCTPGVVTET